MSTSGGGGGSGWQKNELAHELAAVHGRGLVGVRVRREQARLREQARALRRVERATRSSGRGPATRVDAVESASGPFGSV